MKKIFNFILIGSLFVGVTSCKKYLDINNNPNDLLSGTPEIILPQAIVGSASIYNTFNMALADFSGARANAGGFGAFGAVVTYNFGNGDYTAMWNVTYDNVNDFQSVIHTATINPDYANYGGISRIMKAVAFERLINQYNDVPYSEAFFGQKKMTPKYDVAEDIYKALITQIDSAFLEFASAKNNVNTKAVGVANDPLFGGDITLWKKYANTIKLRMLIKMAGVSDLSAYARAEIDKMDLTVGFLTTDAIVNPGYEKGLRPNPVYTELGFSSTGRNVTTSRIPTRWMYAFYNGNRLLDTGRGRVIYRNFPNTPINQLGDESSSVPPALSAGSSWNTTNNETNALGVAKGPTQGSPVFLASESYFLQAEAYLRGYLSGDAKTAFNNGIKESFRYLYKDVNGTVPAVRNIDNSVADYLSNNTTNYLVNFDLALTTDQKLEAIITQKYIALNMVSNDEAFNEYRRTLFPKIVNGSTNPTETFASLKSISTRPDKLPTRVLYPQSEYNLNPVNTPSGINKFSSLIFWAKK